MEGTTTEGGETCLVGRAVLLMEAKLLFRREVSTVGFLHKQGAGRGDTGLVFQPYPFRIELPAPVVENHSSVQPFHQLSPRCCPG